MKDRNDVHLEGITWTLCLNFELRWHNFQGEFKSASVFKKEEFVSFRSIPLFRLREIEI